MIKSRNHFRSSLEYNSNKNQKTHRINAEYHQYIYILTGPVSYLVMVIITMIVMFVSGIEYFLIIYFTNFYLFD